jgi:pimeloyl-ACP methyl ester carboxylesterase
MDITRFESAAARMAAALTLADEATRVDTLIERRGAVHLVGHSYGGAAYEPVLFGCLFADEASAAEARSMRELAAALHDDLGHGRDAAAAERFVDFWSGAGSWQRLPAESRATVAVRMRTVRRHFDAAFGAADPRPLPDRHGVPRLVLTGAATVTATRRVGQLLCAAWPSTEHATLPRIGHMGPLTDGAVLIQHVHDFLLRQVDPVRRDAACSSLQSETT